MDLLKAVVDQLARLGDSVAARIRVKVIDGTVELEGQVATAYERQLLAHTVRQVKAVRGLKLKLGLWTAPCTRREPILPAWVFWLPSCVRPAAWTIGVLVVLSVAWWGWSYATALGRVRHVAATMRVNGLPAGGAHITLHPQLAGKDALRPHGSVRADGSIEWTTFRKGDGVPVGEYVVTAVWHEEPAATSEQLVGASRLPPGYGDPATSPLRLSVGKDGVVPTVLQIAGAASHPDNGGHGQRAPRL